MTLEEISVAFTADTAPFSAAVSTVTALLSSASSQADTLAAAFTSAGANAGDGLRNGILSRRSTVMAAAQSVANAAANAIRQALDIHSPSRLTFQVGTFFDQGLLRGISAGAGQVEQEAASLARSAADALDWTPFVRLPDLPAFSVPQAAPAAESPGQQDISITIPLEIDGYRLGVAAIESINRVSGGTGRVELAL